MEETRKVHVELMCGGRDFSDRDRVIQAVDELVMCALEHGYDLVILQGGARGADRLAAQVGRQAGLKVVEMKADWDRHGKSAGYRRNEAMLARLIDHRDTHGGSVGVTAFPGGRGTEMMAGIARAKGLRVVEA